AKAADEANRLEEEAISAEAHAALLAQELEARSREIAERNAVRHQRELDRRRSVERIESLRRQAALVADDVTRLEASCEERRRLQEIGPTNALAEAEFRELEERYQNMAEQLDDIISARTDLEDLITKLRAEEESRYEAVFGAVAANFHEYFSQLNPGGRATLRHADGDDGPRSGVE